MTAPQEERLAVWTPFLGPRCMVAAGALDLRAPWLSVWLASWRARGEARAAVANASSLRDCVHRGLRVVRRSRVLVTRSVLVEGEELDQLWVDQVCTGHSRRWAQGAVLCYEGPVAQPPRFLEPDSLALIRPLSLAMFAHPVAPGYEVELCEGPLFNVPKVSA